jgi:hypothetical protein
VQFDTTRNRFLAAGDEFLIKFWDMDNINVLTTIDAEGSLQVGLCMSAYRGHNLRIVIVMSMQLTT